MEGCNEPSAELQNLCLPSLRLEGLFMDQTLSYLPKKLAPLNMSTSKSVTTNGGLISPRSPSNSSSSGSKKSIDPSLVSYASMITENSANPLNILQPLHKQAPPPCNEYYLMSCFKGVSSLYILGWMHRPTHFLSGDLQIFARVRPFTRAIVIIISFIRRFPWAYWNFVRKDRSWPRMQRRRHVISSKTVRDSLGILWGVNVNVRPYYRIAVSVWRTMLLGSCLPQWRQQMLS